MCVKSGAEMTEFAQTKPPSGREGDRGSGGRRARNFGLVQTIFRMYNNIFIIRRNILFESFELQTFQ